MKEIVIMAALGVVSLFVGLTCLLKPKKLQKDVLERHRVGKGLAKYNPFINFIRSPAYTFTVRFTGVVAMVIAFVIIIQILREI